jgi:hypothetical protein
MQFSPKALLVTVVFVGLLWFAIDQTFGLVVLAAIVAVLLDAVVGFGLLHLIPAWPRRSRLVGSRTHGIQ